MKIGTREVGPGHPAFIIAECGSNHGGSLDAALALIDAAARAGADAAKFQFFRVDRFIVPRENPELLRRYELPEEWLPYLLDRCARHKIEFLCTAFDLESLDIVDPFVNAHKIGSYEAARPSFVGHVREKGKPIIASAGRIDPGMRLPAADVVLCCRSEYPADIHGYVKPYANPWGVSDHTLNPTIVPCAAVALRACVVEKHVQLDAMRWSTISPNWEVIQQRSPDFRVSILPAQFSEMVEAIRLTESALGLP